MNSKPNIDNNKPNLTITINLNFYHEEPKDNFTWGSNDVNYELIYKQKEGIIYVDELDAFADRHLVAKLWDRRNRGITLDEMLENIQEMSEMTYKEFKTKILKEEN